MDIAIDNEFREWMYTPAESEIASLERSLLEHGCREPLVLWQGILIDGHNRYALCQKHNLPFSVVEYDFPNRDAVKTWIDINQLSRRNVTDLQRIAIVARNESAVVILPPNPGDNETSPAKGTRRRDIAAKKAGVSGKTYDAGKKVLSQAEPELVAATLDGKLPVHTAAQLVNAPPDTQRAIASSPQPAVTARQAFVPNWMRTANKGAAKPAKPAPPVTTPPPSSDDASKVRRAAEIVAKVDSALSCWLMALADRL